VVLDTAGEKTENEMLGLQGGDGKITRDIDNNVGAKEETKLVFEPVEETLVDENGKDK
jgi:hypothetical protein